jgi:hypothetical protein
VALTLGPVGVPPSHRSSLKKLTPRFAPGAKVVLHGCNVGRAEHLSLAVSQVLHARVLAGTTYQRALLPGLEGRTQECFDGTCKTIGGGSLREKIDSMIFGHPEEGDGDHTVGHEG